MPRTEFLPARAPARSRPGNQTSPPTESYVPYTAERLTRRRRCRWCRQSLRLVARLTRRIDEVAEELRIGLQHHTCIALAHAGLVGLHRAIKRKEVQVLAKGLGKDPVAFGIAFAAELFGLRGRLGHQDRDVAIGLGTNFLRLLAALGAELGGFALALRLH